MSAVYLISHLHEAFRYSPDLRFEIQLVDDFCETIDNLYIGESDEIAYVGEIRVPRPVLEAARRLKIGDSDYVGADGKLASPGEASTDFIPFAFFVQHMAADTRCEGQAEGQHFRIDLINRHGQSVASGFIGHDESALFIQGMEIPSEVMLAAKTLAVGPGHYVNTEGTEIGPGEWN